MQIINQRVAVVPIDSVEPHPRNVNRGDLGAIHASLDAHGFYGAIVAQQSSGRVLAGNHRLMAMKQAGASEIPVVFVDVDDDTALRILLVDNKTTRDGYADSNALAELLQELAATPTGLSGSGYDGDALDELLADLGQMQPEQLDSAARRASVFDRDCLIQAALRSLRASGFPYRSLPLHACMQEINKLAATDAESLEHTDTAYHVADTYHPHRFHASADGMLSPYAAFGDDRLLRRALGLILDEGQCIGDVIGKLSIVSGVQACANFRPGFALHLYRRYCQTNATVLDTCAGYGGRLVGFLAAGLGGCYIGIDPNKQTAEGNRKLSADLAVPAGVAVELYNKPAEDVPHEVVAGRCDFALTSPPYFAKERYSDEETQSCMRYPTAERWRSGFLEPLLALQHAALKPGAHAVLVVADVTVRGRRCPVVAWTRAAAERVGFRLLSVDDFRLSDRMGAGHDLQDGVAAETVLAFQRQR